MPCLIEHFVQCLLCVLIIIIIIIIYLHHWGAAAVVKVPPRCVLFLPCKPPLTAQLWHAVNHVPPPPTRSLFIYIYFLLCYIKKMLFFLQLALNFGTCSCNFWPSFLTKLLVHHPIRIWTICTEYHNHKTSSCWNIYSCATILAQSNTTNDIPKLETPWQVRHATTEKLHSRLQAFLASMPLQLSNSWGIPFFSSVSKRRETFEEKEN